MLGLQYIAEIISMRERKMEREMLGLQFVLQVSTMDSKEERFGLQQIVEIISKTKRRIIWI